MTTFSGLTSMYTGCTQANKTSGSNQAGIKMVDNLQPAELAPRMSKEDLLLGSSHTVETPSSAQSIEDTDMHAA